MNTFAMIYALSMSIYWISKHNIEKFCLLKGKHLTENFDFIVVPILKSCFPLSQSYIGLSMIENLMMENIIRMEQTIIMMEL